MLKKRLMQIVLFIFLVTTWELLVINSSSTLIPSPFSCLKALYELATEKILLPDLIASLSRVLVGFAIALAIGLVLGFLLGLIPVIKDVIMGLFELLRPIPPIAWIPIAVALLGIGDASAWFVIFIGAFFPILTNTLLGISNIEKVHIEAAKVLGASKIRSFTGVIWPSTLPSIFAGMRVGLGFAWMCVVAAEMFASRSGLGYQIQLNRQLFLLDRVVAGMITIAIVGFLMSRLMTVLEGVFIPWRRGFIAKDFFENTNFIRHKLPSSQNDSKFEVEAHLYNRSYLQSNSSSIVDWKTKIGVSISIEKLNFKYPSSSLILNDINLCVKPGEFYCVLGLSGCGKSTLLRLIAGLEKNYSGSIMIGNEAMNNYRKDVTMVFQDFSLFPWRTVEGNVRFALEQHKSYVNDEWETEVNHLLSLVGLNHKSTKYPHMLSGGQVQRVAFARALACRPRLMLLDEPFSSLDSHTRESLQEDMADIFKQSGMTVVMVTHDISEAVFMADRIAIMSSDGGNLKKEFIVPLKRPRDRKYRNSPEFRELTEKLWTHLAPN